MVLRAEIEAVMRSLTLLLPALAPSWRFFPSVAASPRIEFRVARAAGPEEAEWREFRPAPRNVSAGAMLKRIFWNPGRNETLFLVTCAERLLSGEIEFARREIARRVARQMPAPPAGRERETFLQFRLILVSGHGPDLRRDVAYVSPVFVPAGLAAA
jgi:hypothetical protein